jgi:hypothetical protein
MGVAEDRDDYLLMRSVTACDVVVKIVAVHGELAVFQGDLRFGFDRYKCFEMY